MPPKEAASVEVNDANYVKLCLKYYKEPMNKANFDFDGVAKEAGLANARAAYVLLYPITR
jgi:hypothetical protein